jgi:hypothetical protein
MSLLSKPTCDDLWNARQSRLERLYAHFEGELMVWVIRTPGERSWGFLSKV